MCLLDAGFEFCVWISGAEAPSRALAHLCQLLGEVPLSVLCPFLSEPAPCPCRLQAREGDPAVRTPGLREDADGAADRQDAQCQGAKGGQWP